MSRKLVHFELFGVKYRHTQLAAIPALAILNSEQAAHPLELLATCEADVGYGWVPLNNESNANSIIIDMADVVAPLQVLTVVTQKLADDNFGFLDGFHGSKVPLRFLSEGGEVQSQYTDPIIARLLTDKSATYRELEEYYSLEDAFKMFDVIVSKNITEALAYEAAEREAKRKSRR